ncbi:MAG: hypothetical protein ABIQ95_13625, partial [Bdellovibrionia bacterium]
FQLFGETPKFLPVVQVLLIFGGGAAWIFLAERSGGLPELKPKPKPEPGGVDSGVTLGGEIDYFRNSEVLGPRPPTLRHLFHLLRKARAASEPQSNSTLAAATMIFVLSFDSLWKNLRWGFHENAIAFCSVSWALALLFSSALGSRPVLKNILIVVLFLLAAGSKEILLLDIAAGFCVWAVFDIVSGRLARKGIANEQYEVKQGSKFFIFKIVLAIALTVGFILFEKMAHPPNKNYFNRYYAYLGGNLAEFLKNLIVAPGLIIHNIGLKALMHYFWVVFSPWLFLLPVFLKMGGRKANLSSLSEVPWLFLILPSFASAALASFPPLRDPAFHYVLELWPVLACVTIKALGRQKSSTLIWGWALMGLIAMDFDPIAEYREYQAQSIRRLEAIKLIDTIPPEAAVMADELAGTWIAGRRWVTRWPDTRLLPLDCPDYVLVEDPSNQKEKEVLELISRCESKAVGMTGESAIISSASISSFSTGSVSTESVQRAGSWVLFKIHGKS